MSARGKPVSIIPPALDPGLPRARALLRVGLCGLDPELEHYVCRHLLARWPRLRFALAADATAMGRLEAQLWITALPPAAGVHVPILWFEGIASEPSLRQVDTGVWRLAMPFTAERLAAAVERVLLPHA